MRPGLKKGNTGATPFSSVTATSAMPSMPPMPEPISTPVLIWSSYVRRPPAGVVERLARRAHGKDDEVVDLALLLRLHPLIGIVGAVAAVAARDHAGDLAGNVGDIEGVDLLGAALAFEQALPRRLDAASERRQHSHPGDDDTSHDRLRAQQYAPRQCASLISQRPMKLLSKRAVVAQLLRSFRGI